MSILYKIKHIFITIAIILFDLFIYMVLGVALMRYDDSYDESKGEYWSWGSLTTFDKVAVIGLNIWHLINLCAIIFVIYKITQFFMNKPHSNQK